MDLSSLALRWLLCFITTAQGQQTILLTEFPEVKSLAACANVFGEISNAVAGDCQPNAAATVSASCACLKDQNSMSISSAISSLVLFAYGGCGSTATDDASSALAAFSDFCAEARPITYSPAPLPTSIVYLTDFPAVKSLAPCANYPFPGQVNALSNDCPNIFNPTSQASCACLKDQNSMSISSVISSVILFGYGGCGPTATEDATSAAVAFSSYCAMIKPSRGTAQTATVTTSSASSTFSTSLTISVASASSSSSLPGSSSPTSTISANTAEGSSETSLAMATISTISTKTISSSAPIASPSSPPNPSNHPTSHVGAIAGGIVGAIAGVIAVSVLIWFILHRRRGQGKGITSSGQSPPRTDWPEVLPKKDHFTSYEPNSNQGGAPNPLNGHGSAHDFIHGSPGGQDAVSGVQPPATQELDGQSAKAEMSVEPRR